MMLVMSACGEMHGFHMARVFSKHFTHGAMEVAPFAPCNRDIRRQSSTRSFSQTNNFSASEVRSTGSYFPMLQNCLETKNEICKLVFILISGDFTAACCFASLFHFPSTAPKQTTFLVDFGSFKIQNCHTCSEQPSDCRVATCYAHSDFTWFSAI